MAEPLIELRRWFQKFHRPVIAVHATPEAEEDLKWLGCPDDFAALIQLFCCLPEESQAKFCCPTDVCVTHSEGSVATLDFSPASVVKGREISPVSLIAAEQACLDAISLVEPSLPRLRIFQRQPHTIGARHAAVAATDTIKSKSNVPTPVDADDELCGKLFLQLPEKTAYEVVFSESDLPTRWDVWLQTFKNLLDFGISEETSGREFTFNGCLAPVPIWNIYFVSSREGVGAEEAVAQMVRQTAPTVAPEITFPATARTFLVVDRGEEATFAEDLLARLRASYPRTLCEKLPLARLDCSVVSPLSFAEANCTHLSVLMSEVIRQGIFPRFEKIVERCNAAVRVNRRSIRGHLRTLLGRRVRESKDGNNNNSAVSSFLSAGGEAAASSTSPEILEGPDVLARLAGEIQLCLGDWTGAVASFKLAVSSDRPETAAAAGALEGIAYALQGTRREALQCLSEAIRIWQAAKMPRHATLGQLLHVRILIAFGEALQAAELLRTLGSEAADAAPHAPPPEDIVGRATALRSAVFLDQAAELFVKCGRGKRAEFLKFLTAQNYGRAGLRKAALDAYARLAKTPCTRVVPGVHAHVGLAVARLSFTLGLSSDAFFRYAELLSSAIRRATTVTIFPTGMAVSEPPDDDALMTYSIGPPVFATTPKRLNWTLQKEQVVMKEMLYVFRAWVKESIAKPPSAEDKKITSIYYQLPIPFIQQQQSIRLRTSDEAICPTVPKLDPIHAAAAALLPTKLSPRDRRAIRAAVEGSLAFGLALPTTDPLDLCFARTVLPEQSLTVECVIRNPMQTPLELTNIHLHIFWTPAAASSVESTAAAWLPADSNVSQQVIEKIKLAGREIRKLEISWAPLTPGIFQVAALRTNLFGEIPVERLLAVYGPPRSWAKVFQEGLDTTLRTPTTPVRTSSARLDKFLSTEDAGLPSPLQQAEMLRDLLSEKPMHQWTARHLHNSTELTVAVDPEHPALHWELHTPSAGWAGQPISGPPQLIFRNIGRNSLTALKVAIVETPELVVEFAAHNGNWRGVGKTITTIEQLSPGSSIILPLRVFPLRPGTAKLSFVTFAAAGDKTCWRTCHANFSVLPSLQIQWALHVSWAQRMSFVLIAAIEAPQTAQTTFHVTAIGGYVTLPARGKNSTSDVRAVKLSPLNSSATGNCICSISSGSPPLQQLFRCSPLSREVKELTDVDRWRLTVIRAFAGEHPLQEKRKFSNSDECRSARDLAQLLAPTTVAPASTPLLDVWIEWRKASDDEDDERGMSCVYGLSLFSAQTASSLRFLLHPSQRGPHLNGIKLPSGTLLPNLLEMTLQNVGPDDALRISVEGDLEAGYLDVPMQTSNAFSLGPAAQDAIKLQGQFTHFTKTVLTRNVPADQLPPLLAASNARFPASGGLVVGSYGALVERLEPGASTTLKLSYLALGEGVKNLNKFRFTAQRELKDTETQQQQQQKVMAFPFKSILVVGPETPADFDFFEE